MKRKNGSMRCGLHMRFMEVFRDLNPEIVPGLGCFNAANGALREAQGGLCR